MLTWGEGGVDEKITDYVDMGSGLQKLDLFCVKSKIRFTFSEKMSIFLIYLYTSSILYHYIFLKMAKMMRYIFPRWQKSDVIDLMSPFIYIITQGEHEDPAATKS